MRAIVKVFPNKEELVSQLSQETASRLQSAIKERGIASYVAAGGSTVPDLFKNLSDAEVDWDKVHITLSDERWVRPGDHNSNQHLVSTTLLKNKAANSLFTPLLYDCRTSDEGAKMAHSQLLTLPSPFDVTLLGMGADRHTASLFPNSNGLTAALDPVGSQMVCSIGPIQGAAGPETRLTLSLSALLSSRVIYIMITGAKKWEALEAAMSETDPALSPVSAILNNDKCPVFVYWCQA